MRWTLARVAVGLGLAQMLAGGVVLTPVAIASDLSDQLSIKLYNGTRGNSRIEADRLVRLGNQQQQAGFSDKAIGSWLQALEIYHTIKETEAEGTTYEALGKPIRKSDDLLKPKMRLRRSLAIARDTKNFQNQIYGANNLGTLLLQRASVSEAQKALQRALKSLKTSMDPAGLGLSLSNLGLSLTPRAIIKMQFATMSRQSRCVSKPAILE